MGYRLEVGEIINSVCGGKLFGYVEDEKTLKSLKYLVDNNLIRSDAVWGYSYNPKIILNSQEFREFIKLYNEDRGFTNEELEELAKSGSSKLLEWF